MTDRRAPSRARGGVLTAWAIDLGTRNTAICRWNKAQDRPELVALPEICRLPEGTDPLQAPRLIPSATHLEGSDDFWTRLGRQSFFARRFYWGSWGLIGQQAVDRNLGSPHKLFVPTFKRWLGRASNAPLARSQDKVWSARDVAQVFLRELFAETARTTGERIERLVITAPVESFEAYRAELKSLCKSLGVTDLTFVDEPVAAALGYGLGLSSRRHVLVVDFGAGTLDLALVNMSAREVEEGRCTVVAKSGRPVGGDHVDDWILQEVYARMGVTPPAKEAFWHRQMLDEARRVKEMSYVRGKEVFQPAPSEAVGSAAHLAMKGDEVEVDQPFIRRACEAHGLFRVLNDCLEELLEQARRHDLHADQIEDVLMVGGSTLLPGVFPFFEERFGRDRVRAWRPFEAVAWGATALSAGAYANSDFIVHDYAILTHDAETGDPVYTPIIRKGTRFPTRDDHWRRQLVPTCALGEPETMFKLVVCEMGTATEDERLFGWDAKGEVHALRGQEDRLIVPLNEHAPTLGTLDPPHRPSDRKARLDVSFGINAHRWLVATVRDLATGKKLMNNEPVVRLL